jgi:hypothetical protein
LYFAENPAVAGDYQKTISSDVFKAKDGALFDPATLEHLNVRSIARRGDLDSAISKAKEIAGGDSPVAAHAARDLEVLENLKARGGIEKHDGNLYRVEINRDAVGRMVDWDKPLSEQPDAIRAAIENSKIPEIWQKQIGHSIDINKPQIDMIYKVLADEFGGADAASGYLKSIGISGIRYLDQGSRNVGQLKITPPSETVAGDWMVKGNDYNAKGVHFRTEVEAKAYLKAEQTKQTSNFVLFDASLAKITDKNGKPVRTETVVPSADRGAGTPPSDSGEPAASAANIVAMEAERFVADRPDVEMTVGQEADGTPIRKSAKQFLEDARADTAKAAEDSKLFDVAAACMMGVA